MHLSQFPSVWRLLFGAAVGIALSATAPLAQVAVGVAPELAEARRVLAAGQVDDALKLVNALLVRVPADRDAVETKVNILMGRDQFGEALAAYDAYVVAVRRPDQAMLKAIAVADLRRVVRDRSGDPMLVAAGLERLARAGDAEAVPALKRLAASTSPTSPQGLAPFLSLARLADAETRRSLGSLLDAAPADGRILLIKTIQDAGATAQAPSIAARLDDPEPAVRSAAAVAVGVLQYRPAIPQLKAMFTGDSAIVRMYAAMALKRLGDTSVDEFVAKLLKSEVPDVRLMAAEAFQGTRSQEWLSLVAALRNDPNEVNRIRAATLMACCDAAAARAILVGSLSSPVQLVRLEAARVIEEKGLGDAVLARRLLGDSFDPVRMSGAGIAATPAKPLR